MRFLLENSRRLCASVALVFAALAVLSAKVPERPVPARLVNDFASVLSSEQIMSLEQRLAAFDDTTSNQIAVLFVNDLGGQDISAYAIEVGESWGVGNAEHDNGIVVVVKPKTSSERGQAFIAVGYGLEGAIPDAVARRIVDNVMIPHFAENDYYGGVSEGVDKLMGLASGEISVSDIEDEGTGGFVGVLVAMVVFFIIVSVLSSSRRRGGGSDTFSDKGHSAGGLPPIFFGGFGGGHGSGGGFGGGFGGFGGGSFGGGGAGGSW